jgi:DNA-binding response OmpR family regulator
MNPVLLLVEDDAVLRGGLSELFTREGYRVIEAGSVREARQKKDETVQAIGLDVDLPDGDGVSLCREWRGQGETRPILFLTAKDEESTWCAAWIPAATIT